MARKNLVSRSSLFSSTLPRLFRHSPFSIFTEIGGRTVRDSRSFGTLAFDEIPPPEEYVSGLAYTSTALVLHGLLGSGRNWRTFASSLAERLRNTVSDSSEVWRMVLVDLRNHGKSARINGLHPPHDMVNTARDLANLVKSQEWDWPKVVIGHSMGGKVALEFAKSCSCGNYGEVAVLPKQLWVLDSVPGEVNVDHSDGEVEKVLKTLESFPSPLPSRRWVVDRMLELGFSKSLSEWIGSNVKSIGGQVVWTFDIHAATSMFESYRETSYWSLLEHPPEGLDIAIVRAENSDRWSSQIIQRLENLSRKTQELSEGRVSLYTLSNSGHWVHVDNPKGLLEIMAPNFVR